MLDKLKASNADDKVAIHVAVKQLQEHLKQKLDFIPTQSSGMLSCHGAFENWISIFVMGCRQRFYRFDFVRQK
jgi:hypothetical protein